jgi:hypothetical protein
MHIMVLVAFGVSHPGNGDLESNEVDTKCTARYILIYSSIFEFKPVDTKYNASRCKSDRTD